MNYRFHIDPRNTHGAKSEISVQSAFIRRLRETAPRVMVVGIPNAGKRTQWEKLERAREGMVPGFPDMLAMFDGRTAALEFKSGIGTLSDNQIDVLNRLVQLDFPVGVFRSADSAIDWLQGHWPSAFGETA